MATPTPNSMTSQQRVSYPSNSTFYHSGGQSINSMAGGINSMPTGLNSMPSPGGGGGGGGTHVKLEGGSPYSMTNDSPYSNHGKRMENGLLFL